MSLILFSYYNGNTLKEAFKLLIKRLPSVCAIVQKLKLLSLFRTKTAYLFFFACPGGREFLFLRALGFYLKVYMTDFFFIYLFIY